MAPVPGFMSLFTTNRLVRDVDPISDLYTASVALDRRDAESSPTTAQNLVKRAATTYDPGAGTISPESFHNSGMLALFAIIGATMVLASIWFFFWAKNGGFHFRKSDWDDYKSTVLRRKGPDGRTLSNATKSTKLGGGTIAGSQHYAWQKHIAHSVVGRDEKGRKGVLAKRGWGGTHSITYSDDYMTGTLASQTVTDEMTELRSEPDAHHDAHHSKRYRDRDVKAYKKEKPARVGGLNRVAEGSHFDSATERSDLLTDTMTETSEQPILTKKHRDDSKEKQRERAERRAREEAKKMERRWKREAEEAAAALARESHHGAAAPSMPTPPKKSATPSARPSTQRQRQRSASRSASPRKPRDFSYESGPASEVLSTAYTGVTSNRSTSYYDEYRPRATENPRYPDSDHSGGRRTRQSSPRKKPAGTRSGGYRRGVTDSDLDE